MREGDRRRIGRVAGLRRGLQSQETHHHELDLLFRRGARPDDGLLDLGRGILVHRETGLFAGEEHHAARMPEHDRRAHVARVEHVFNRQRLGLCSR